jgi:DNA-binding CsgD family transcriptional regulator
MTEKQIEILQMLADGMLQKQIAGKLGRNRCTVRFHITRMLRSTKSVNTPNLVAWGFRNGIIK